MKIVIDIDEGDYAVILANADIVNKRKKHTLEEAVLNGTPLPKGHGRLIDADELDSDLKERQKSYEHTFDIRQPINEAIKDGIIIARTHINYAQTIIEADKGE